MVYQGLTKEEVCSKNSFMDWWNLLAIDVYVKYEDSRISLV